MYDVVRYPDEITVAENRLFRSKNRIYELLLYDFLNMFYASEIAKVKKTNTHLQLHQLSNVIQFSLYFKIKFHS